MPFTKGQEKTGGKPKGYKDVKTRQWDALSESITGEQAEKFSQYMATLWESTDKQDKRDAAELYLKTVEYFKPKQARVESIVTGDLTISSVKFEDADDSKD